MKPCIGHDRLILKLTDHGSGMSEEQVNRIFDPFYKQGSLSKYMLEHNQGKGRGIGLTLCKMLCDKFGWDIRFES